MFRFDLSMHVSSRWRIITWLIAVTLGTAECSGQGLGFGTPEGKTPLRGFGTPLDELALRRRFPKFAAAVTKEDRENAAREIQRTDGNKDGVVTESEWAASGFQTVDRFHNNDLNGDGTLTLFEHSLHWAQYRLGKEQQSQPNAVSRSSTSAQSTQVGKGPAPSVSTRMDSRNNSRRAQTAELATFAMTLYDRDRNGSIGRNEFHSSFSTFGNVGPADADEDGVIVVAEMATWLMARLASQPVSKLPDDVPIWFLTSDFDADGQVQLSEYLRVEPRGTIGQFERYDRNADGFVTANELASPLSNEANRYASSRSSVIESETDTPFDLLVTDDVVLQDIDVQLAIVKNGDDDIELSLIGPDGTRAVLYFDGRAKPWGGGRLFEDTVIDDEVPTITQRLPRPPLRKTFPSQGTTTGGQGLKAFYGKRSRGIWRLVIRNKSQVAGLLEGWALLIKPSIDQ